jgi:uncharacterized protein YlxP (DUF503 family)
MKAYIGLYTARLEMPWVRSLKEKRSLIKPILEQIRARFPVSAARLAGQETWDWEIIGLSVLSADGHWVEEVLQAAARFLNEQGSFRVAEESLTVDGYSLEELIPFPPS